MSYNILSNDEIESLNKLVKKFRSEKDTELEIVYKGVNYPLYIRTIEKLIDMTSADAIVSSSNLDISIEIGNKKIYRVSFTSQDLINKFLSKCSGKNSNLSKNDIIKYIASIKPGTPDTNIMIKSSNDEDNIMIDNIGCRIRVSKEDPVNNGSDRIEFTGNEKITYRMKTRHSFKINKNVQFDMTEVQQSYNSKTLLDSRTFHEIEIEVINKDISPDAFVKEIKSALIILQDSDNPISKAESDAVIADYKKLLDSKSIHLEKRISISMEAQHIIKFIPNKYAVVDKADGERHQLFSMSYGLYLISNNLSVKKLNFVIDKTKYHKMILDGELIDNEHGKMFLVFDIVFANDNDYRFESKYNLKTRINAINAIIDDCFGSLVTFTDYASKKSDMILNKIIEFYANEIEKYWTDFKKKMKKTNSDGKLFITRKIYFVPYGIGVEEVFAYADTIWKNYVYKKNMVPYNLDGIIYTNLDSPYMIKIVKSECDNIPLEYKWKEPNQNSIDFYILFEKDSYGNDLIFYDQSVKKGEGKPYKIALLRVGESDGDRERPVPFKIGGIEQKAYIYCPEGIARDKEGRPIDDKTVVEFIYDSGENYSGNIDNLIQRADSGYRWIPLRTRYDKTETVSLYRKSYGNPRTIAERIWKSISNPITENTISLLGNPSSYDKEFEKLKDYTKSSVKNFVYYQKQTDRGEHMRNFHNFIKGNMISSYCMRGTSVLDIGCGRGGDINKFINAGVSEYVGTDVDSNGLFVIDDCAQCRYEGAKKRNKNIPPMYFINADSKGLFDVESQTKIISDMSDDNKKMIEKFLSGKKKYNAINCQFTLHYYLDSEISWNNFCTNINKLSDKNSYFLITTFDGELIRDKLMKKKKMIMSFTDNEGKKSIFAEITKLYDDDDKNHYGQSINLYNSTISEEPVKEYLVDPKFLISSLEEKCGMKLVESDSFFNLFQLYKTFFMRSDDVKKNKIKTYFKMLDPKYYNEFSSGDIELARASFAFSSLNRYYIFKKEKSIDIDNPSRIIGINNQILTNNSIFLNKIITPHLIKNNIYIDINNEHKLINKLYDKSKMMIGGGKPNIYLLRHSISEDKYNDNIVVDNKIEFLRIKEGSGNISFMFYKSPSKVFYPIYHMSEGKEVYAFSGDKIFNELEYLCKMTPK